MHKILLVEDDEIIRQQVKQLLEQWGYEVVAVEDFRRKRMSSGSLSKPTPT